MPNFAVNRSGTVRQVFECSQTYSAPAAGAEVRKATVLGQKSEGSASADILQSGVTQSTAPTAVGRGGGSAIASELRKF